MNDLYIEIILQTIKDIASASCVDIKDADNIASFCDEIYSAILKNDKIVEEKLRRCTNIENREYPYFNGFKEGKQVGYYKAIDDYKNRIKEELDRFEVQYLDTCVLYDLIDRKAEQLKAGNRNES